MLCIKHHVLKKILEFGHYIHLTRHTVMVRTYSVYMSEWLLINVNSAICQLYLGENKLICNEMMMRPALY